MLALRRELERPSATLAVAADGTLPSRVLLLGSAARGDQFVAEGISMGLEVVTRELADAQHAVAEEAPDAIVIEADSGDADNGDADALAALLDALGTRLAIPALVITAHDTMSVRLAIARSGASGPLLPGQPPAMILERVATAIAAREQGQPSVLLVEGDPYALQATTLMLEQGGMRVLPLGDPMAFWETLESVQPDAVVTAATMAGDVGRARRSGHGGRRRLAVPRHGQGDQRRQSRCHRCRDAEAVRAPRRLPHDPAPPGHRRHQRGLHPTECDRDLPGRSAHSASALAHRRLGRAAATRTRSS